MSSHLSEHRRSSLLCDRIAQWLLVGLLAFMPLAFGAVEAWSELVVYLVCAGMLLCLGYRAWRWDSTGGLRWTSAYIPLAAFVLLGTIQALPIPFPIIQLLSPHTASLYQNFRDEVIGSFTLSLYPHATWHDLCLVIAASVIFLTAVNVLRHSAQILQTLLAVAFIGSALAILALLQDLFGNGQIYWIGPKEVQPGSGTFICHNHFSQHMNLAVMAMLAYAMVQIRQTLGRRWLHRNSIAAWLNDPETRLARWLMAFAVMGLIAVAMSTSRMGIISSGAAMVAMTMMLTRKRSRRNASVPLLVGIVATSVIILIGFEVLFERMATLETLDSYAGRWTVVTDLIPAFGHFPLIGSGLGTFSAVYPLYDTGKTWMFASHAENEYAQLLLEMGIVGASLFAWFVVTIIRSTIRATRRINDPILTVAPALAAGLIAVAIHSWTDFGQHLPAIACISALYCGILVVLGQRATKAPRIRPISDNVDLPESPTPYRTRNSDQHAGLIRLVLALLALVLLLNLPAAWWRISAEQHDARAHVLAAELDKVGWRVPEVQTAAVLNEAQSAVDDDPSNVLYRYRLGVYRWWATVRGRTREEIGAQVPPEFRNAAEQIVSDMIVASSKCPTMGAVHCWRGQLEWWVLGLEEGRERVETGIQTARNDPIAWCAAAQLSAAENKPDEALQRLTRALELRRGVLSHAVRILSQDCHRPDLVLELVAGNPQRLYDASSLLQNQGFETQAKEARAQAMAAYENRLDDPQTPAWAYAMLAESKSQQSQHEQAITLYRRAIAKEYTRLAWHLACTRELLLAGQFDEAERELQTCQHLNRDASEIHLLTRTLNAARAAATQPTTRPTQPQPAPSTPTPEPATKAPLTAFTFPLSAFRLSL